MTNDTDHRSDTAEHDKREAQVNHDASGQPLGAAVFLAAEDIDALGIDLDGTDSVAYWIESGEVRLASSARTVSDE